MGMIVALGLIGGTLEAEAALRHLLLAAAAVASGVRHLPDALARRGGRH